MATPSISDEQARRICDAVEHKFLKLEDACRLEGINRITFGTLVSGDNPRQPLWREWWDRAKASAISHWIELGGKYAEDNNNAGVKFCNQMLMALDRARFRDDKGKAAGQVTVNIIQGSSAIVDIPEVEVLEGTGQVRLLEAEGED